MVHTEHGQRQITLLEVSLIANWPYYMCPMRL